MKIKRFFRCFGKFFLILLTALIVLVLVGNIYLAAAKNIFGQKEPTFFGFSTSVVLTGSMSGTIEATDIIVTHKQGDYAIGDIITFSSGNSTVTHRITGFEEDGYRTKGDANNIDEAVKKESVIGKVILIIPKLGTVFLFVRTPIGMLCFFGLTALILEFPNIINFIKKRKNAE